MNLLKYIKSRFKTYYFCSNNGTLFSDSFILSPKTYEAVTGRKEVKDKDTPIAYKGY